MKRILIVLLLATSAATYAQAPAKAPIKVPTEQAAKFRQLQDDYDKTVKHLQDLQAQWVILAQRAALEAGMSAKDYDAMDLAPSADGGFEFRVKQKADAGSGKSEKKP